MNILTELQEKYITEFTNNVSLADFVVNALMTALLISALRWYYIRFGTAVSNRQKFSTLFLPLALGTLLIIMIVKSSIALSLGLVGALSIVRYRAAIKDPEELTYLFICIGIGLAGGANQPILALVATFFILTILYIASFRQKAQAQLTDNKMYLHVRTHITDLAALTAILEQETLFLSLQRADYTAQGINATYLCQPRTLQSLVALQTHLKELDTAIELSWIAAA